MFPATLHFLFVACDEENSVQDIEIQVTPNPIDIAAPEVGDTTSSLDHTKRGHSAELIIRDIAFSNVLMNVNSALNILISITVPMEEELRSDSAILP